MPYTVQPMVSCYSTDLQVAVMCKQRQGRRGLQASKHGKMLDLKYAFSVHVLQDTHTMCFDEKH